MNVLVLDGPDPKLPGTRASFEPGNALLADVAKGLAQIATEVDSRLNHLPAQGATWIDTERSRVLAQRLASASGPVHR